MKTSSVIFSLLLAGLLPPSPSWAAANIDHLFVLSLEELLKIKVTGSTLTPKELKTVPAAVTVFTHRQITNMGLDSLDELMNLVPGFQSYRSSQSPLHYPMTSRGRRIAQSGSEILVLVDGMRLEEPRISGGTHIAPKFPLLQVGRVEFIRGPGSAVYGSNAMMGVINIVTRNDVDEASMGIGSFNRRKGHLLTNKQSGDLSFDLFASWEADDGDNYQLQDTFGSGQINTQDPRELTDVNIKLKWQDTRLNLHHKQFETKDFYELDRLSNGFNRRNGEFMALMVRQSFRWRAVASNIAVSYTRAGYSTALQLTAPGQLFTNSNPPSNDALLARVDFKDASETRIMWHNDWSINSYDSLQFGLELRQIDSPEVIGENNFDVSDLVNANSPIRYYGNLLATTQVQAQSTRDIVGVYGQYQHQLFDNTHLTMGLRHDDFSQIGAQLSPRIALVHELNTHHSIKLLYGEAFRAPAEGELNLLNNPVVIGNPDLVPETVQSSELIWLGQWPRSGISLGYFESRFKDAIVQVGSGNVLVFDNMDQEPSKGVELEVSHQLTGAWLVGGTYTYFLETPALSFRESDRLASFMVNYQQANWNGNLAANYQSNKDMAARDSNGERITLDGYWQLFGKVRYYLKSDLQIFIQGKNLLNKGYLTPPASTTLMQGIPNRGREILTGLTFEF